MKEEGEYLVQEAYTAVIQTAETTGENTKHNSDTIYANIFRWIYATL